MVISRDARPARGASGAGRGAPLGTGCGPALLSVHSPRARNTASLQRGLSELTGPGAAKLDASGALSVSGERRKYITSKPAGPLISYQLSLCAGIENICP